MSETALIEDCINNSAVAQRELYNRFSGILFAICYRYASNKSDAEDMLQEGFIKIFTKINSFENKGNFEGWMKKVIVHTCINYIKKNKKFGEIIYLDNVYNLEIKEESIASRLLGKQVMDCLRSLPLGYRTVINLYAIEGYSHKEIGDILEIGESTSRSQYIRGKNVLESVLINRKIIQPGLDRVEWLAYLNN